MVKFQRTLSKRESNETFPYQPTMVSLFEYLGKDYDRSVAPEVYRVSKELRIKTLNRTINKYEPPVNKTIMYPVIFLQTYFYMRDKS
jgi:hypothetical protein